MVARIPRILLQQIRNMINEFRWNEKKPSIRISVLQNEMKKEIL